MKIVEIVLGFLFVILVCLGLYELVAILTGWMPVIDFGNWHLMFNGWW